MKRGQTELGFFGSVPSLHDLQMENRKRTKHHYGNHYSSGTHRMFSHKNLSPYFEPPFDNFSSPGTNDFTNPWDYSPAYVTGRAFVPPAAPTPPSFPGTDLNPLATPTVAPHTNTGADKLQAEGLYEDLDFFADNRGLVIYADTPNPSESDGEMDSHSLTATLSDSAEGHGGEDEEMDSPKERNAATRAAASALFGEGDSLHGRIIHRLRDRVNQQEAYITELEDSNLRYKERLDLVLHQLRELQENIAANNKNKDTSSGGGADGAGGEHLPGNAESLAAVPAPSTAGLAPEGREPMEDNLKCSSKK